MLPLPFLQTSKPHNESPLADLRRARVTARLRNRTGLSDAAGQRHRSRCRRWADRQHLAHHRASHVEGAWSTDHHRERRRCWGTIGTARVVRAEPDGYTLLIYHVGLATAATLYRKLPYDTRTAFAAVGLVTDAPMTIIGRSDLEPNLLGDLVAYLKRPGTKTTFGNAGIGSASHLCGMLLASE